MRWSGVYSYFEVGQTATQARWRIHAEAKNTSPAARVSSAYRGEQLLIKRWAATITPSPPEEEGAAVMPPFTPRVYAITMAASAKAACQRICGWRFTLKAASTHNLRSKGCAACGGGREQLRAGNLHKQSASRSRIGPTVIMRKRIRPSTC
ncbi:hypothetical protein MRX96_018336 [Rhipicephalus microplus]